MAQPTLYNGTSSALVVGTETFINVSDVGFFTFEMDLDIMDDGDVLEFRVYQITLTGGAAVLSDVVCFYGADGGLGGGKKKWHSETFWNNLAETNALRFSLKQTFGTGRAIPRKVMKAA